MRRNSLRIVVRIERTRSAHQLGKYEGQQVHRAEAPLEILSNGYGRVDMSTADASNEDNRQRQSRTNHKGITTTHENGEDEKEGAEVLGEIGGGSHDF